MAHAHLIKPGTKVDLNHISTDATDGLSKEEGLAKIETLGKKLESLQEMLFSAGTNSLLIVLQGMDTSGKDGTIRRILTSTNVQSTAVIGFKQPTALEVQHDFLWRIHPNAPRLGGISIFNRSHYEDVIVVRVHELVPKHVWERRYEQINAFESLLAHSQTLIVKFYLHISKDEQKKRLLAREDDPMKAWKLSPGDWKERELWPKYQEAASDALEKCSTKDAPWRVVPADHKWFRDLAIIEALVDTLQPCEKEWKDNLKAIGKEKMKALKEFRAKE